MVNMLGDIGQRKSTKPTRQRLDARPIPGSGRPPLKHVQGQRPIVAKSNQHAKRRGLQSFAAPLIRWSMVQILAALKQRLAAKSSLWPKKPAARVGRLLAAVGPVSFTSDRAIAAAGLAAAAGSAGFAGYMIFTTGGSGGLDSSASSVTPPPPISELRQQQSESSGSVLFDHEATGAIHPRRVRAEPPLSNSAHPPQTVKDQIVATYVLRFVDQNAALIQGPTGVSAVVPGMRLPDVGMILTIEQREGAWIVMTESGIIAGPQF